MGKTKKKLTREEKLEKDRLRKKQEYMKIKNDPELYSLQKEKEKKRYLLKKQQNKIQNIKSMSTRAQREQRRRWRENSRKYSTKQKEQRKIQRILIENSPPTTENEDNDPVVPEPVPDVDPLAQKSVDESKNMPRLHVDSAPVRKLRYNAMKVINNLKEEINKLKKEKDVLRKRTKKLELQQKEAKITIEDSLEKKIDHLIKDIPEEQVQGVKKKLLFDETISRGIKQKYESLKKTEKRSFVEDIILCNDSKLKKYKIKGQMPFTIRKKLSEARKNNANEMKQKVQDFFEDDITSSVAPGKKEFIKRGGITHQKRYLTDNLKNLHNKYCKKYGKISYATFCKYRPYWTVFPDGKRDTCLCKLHCNANLLLQSLKTAKIITHGTVAEMLDCLCCDSNNDACLKRSCNNCKDKSLNYSEFDNTQNIKYKEWIVEKKTYLAKNGKQQTAITTTKKTFEDKPRNLILKLEGTMDVLFKHTHNIISQTSAIKTLKGNLTDVEVLIHVDFSENYSLKFHEEVQSFHFGGSRGQISLHTVVLYYVDHNTGLVTPKSMCTMSQCLNHDASAIWAHILPVLNVAKELVPSLSRVHFLSDSPSSQYRNRFIFYMVTRLHLVNPALNLVTWNYQEAGHGKGAPDGIGAVIKRTADRHVKFGGDVGNFEDFENVLRQEIANIELLPEHEVSHKKFPEKVPGFKGTTKVHQAIWSLKLPHIVALRSLSCFNCQFSDQPCEHGKHLGFIVHDSYDEQEDLGVNIEDCRFTLSEIDTPTVFNNFDDNMILNEFDGTMFLEGTPSQSVVDEIGTPTVFNNGDVNMTLNEFDGTMSLEGNPSESVVDEINTPTVFNNDDDDLILNEFDGTMLQEENPSQSVLVEKKKSLVKILSNVPFDFTHYKSRLNTTHVLMDSSSASNIDDRVILEPCTSKAFDQNCEEKYKTSTPMQIDEDKENIPLKYNLDDWVVVEYTVKNKTHYFIGKIVDRDEVTYEYNLTYLKKSQGKILKFDWPNISDDDVVTESQIVQSLLEPEKDRRGQFLFKNLPNLYFK